VLRRTILITAVAGATLAPAALAAKPGKPTPPGKAGYALSVDATPNPVVFGASTTLSGKLTGPTAAGVTIRLEQDVTLPLGDKYVPTGATTTTAASGAWSLAASPRVNTLYRAVAQTSPDTTSPVERVNVRPSIRLSLSDSTPRKGQLVRFSGTVTPAHDALTALIQKRSSTGAWITVARAALSDDGPSRSSYARRLRVRASGVYRVKLAEHADHTNGFSRLRTVRVG
jgi:hypothetical protein